MRKRETFLSILPPRDEPEAPNDKEVPQETPSQEEVVLSDDYLNSKIEEIRDDFRTLAPETLAEAERKMREVFASYREKISPESESMKKMKNSPKLIAQLKNFALAFFKKEIKEIIAPLQRELGKSFLHSFERTDQEEQKAVRESPEYLFNLLSLGTGHFESEVKKKIDGCLDDEIKRELSQSLKDVREKKQAIEDKYRNSLSDLESVKKENRSDLTDTGITDVKYTAKVVLREEIRELGRWMEDTLRELGIN